MPHMMTTRKRQASSTNNEAVGAPKRPCGRPSCGRRQQSRDNTNTKAQSLVMNSGSPEHRNGTVSQYTAKNPAVPEPEQPEQRLELSPSRTDQIVKVVSEEKPNEPHTQDPNPNLRSPTQYLIVQTSPNELFVFQQVANVVSDRPLVPLDQDPKNLRLQSLGTIGTLFWNTLKHNIVSYIRGPEPNLN